MKFKFLALLLSVATFTSINLCAQNTKLMSKDPSKTPFYSASHIFTASHNSAQVYNGSSTATFQPLTFHSFIHRHGRAIKADGTKFRLKEGTYRLSFTGTFSIGLGLIPEGFAQTTSSSTNFEVAVQLGSKVIFINTQAQELDNDYSGIVSFTKIIRVKKPTDVSIVVRNTSNGTNVVATTRSVTFKKL